MRFKSDKYRKARGGSAKLLVLLCAKCDHHLFYYQKDGSGILKRLYLDRIVRKSKIPFGKQLTCSQCKTLIAVRMTYQTEKRPALRLFAGAVAKKSIHLEKVANGWGFF
jgi:hypothetical protein